MQTDYAENTHTNQTSCEKDWAWRKTKRSGGRGNYKDNWIWIRRKGWQGPHPKIRLRLLRRRPFGECMRRPDDRNCRNGGAGDRANSREYYDWAHGDILENGPNYASYICQERQGRSPEQQLRRARPTLMAFGSENQRCGMERNPKRPTR